MLKSSFASSSSLSDKKVLILKTCFVLLVCAVFSGAASAELSPLDPPTNFGNDDAFLNYVERQTFNYFWDEANTNNGLTRLRTDKPEICSVAAVGFGLSAMCIGVERGWITREQGRERVLATLHSLYDAPQGSAEQGCSGNHGWFYHLLDINTATREGTSEMSSSDTTLLMSGVLMAGQFFDDPDNPEEAAIRKLSGALFNRVDWSFMLKKDDDTVYLHWLPERGYSPKGYRGYNQVSYIYIYGLGATNHPLPAASWLAWESGINWRTNYGYSYAYIGRLFCYQYSHCFIDYRGIADAYMRAKGSDYFENSRRATLAQREYAINNPKQYPNYGSNEWGWTSSTGPGRYGTYGAPGGKDDGTIAPTAAAGSMPFAPEICLPALKHMFFTYTNRLWTNEGFRDSFNISSNWFAPSDLAIDEGPVLLMIENHRSGLVWRRMMNCPVVRRGLQRAGFRPLPSNAFVETERRNNLAKP